MTLPQSFALFSSSDIGYFFYCHLPLVNKLNQMLMQTRIACRHPGAEAGARLAREPAVRQVIVPHSDDQAARRPSGFWRP